jgi:hypothetical protein
VSEDVSDPRSLHERDTAVATFFENSQRAAKMHDIFAVQLFPVENLLQLLRAVHVYDVDYLMPFVMWYATTSISDWH